MARQRIVGTVNTLMVKEFWRHVKIVPEESSRLIQHDVPTRGVVNGAVSQHINIIWMISVRPRIWDVDVVLRGINLNGRRHILTEMGRKTVTFVSPKTVICLWVKM